MKLNEGYIKFKCNWIKSNPVSKDIISEINTWRNNLYNIGLIGAYDDGIGYGNLSIRIKKQTFLITGSATGNLNVLNENHYTLVSDYDILKNELTCIGPIKASSESLSHAMIYECFSETNAVIHVHNEAMWNKYFNLAPTTDKYVEYGTPEMAIEIDRLFKETNLAHNKFLVMGGHREGIIAFGKTLAEAGEILLRACK